MQYEQLRSASNHVQTSRSQLTNLVQIGRGSYGTVYTAKHVDWGMVAYKCLNVKDKFIDSSWLSTVIKEINAHSKLHHPNITQMLGIVSEPDFELGIVLKYEQYGNAFNFVHKFHVDWPWKVEMMYCVSLGLNYLHKSNPPLIHGDIKIHNVLIGDDFVAKLSDFGLSKWRGYTTSRNTVYPRGTMTHIAPERLRNINAKRNEMADIYSFGILVWELLTGILPFVDNPDALIVEAVKSGSRPDLTEIATDVPAAVRDVMEQCWDDQPDKRPDSRAVTSRLETLRGEYKQQIEKCRHDLRMQDSMRRLSGPFDGSGERSPIQMTSQDSWNSPGVAIPQRSGRTNPAGPTEVSNLSPWSTDARLHSDNNSQDHLRPVHSGHVRHTADETSSHHPKDRPDTMRKKLKKLIAGKATPWQTSTPSAALPPAENGAILSAAARTLPKVRSIADLSRPAAAAVRGISVDEDMSFCGGQTLRFAASGGYRSETDLRIKKRKQRRTAAALSIGPPTDVRHHMHFSRDGIFVSDRTIELERSSAASIAQLDRLTQSVNSLSDDLDLRSATLAQPRPTSPNANRATISHTTAKHKSSQPRQR